jgi:hypothetical protein
MIGFGKSIKHSKRNQTMVAPPGYGHRSITGNLSLRRCAAAYTRIPARDHTSMIWLVQQTRRLTLDRMKSSTTTIGNGVELTVADSDQLLRRE